jgi:hypothetical protein
MRKRIIKESDRKFAHKVSEWKSAILRALRILSDNKGTSEKIRNTIVNKKYVILNDYDEMYNKLNKTGTPVHKVWINRHAFGLKELKRKGMIADVPNSKPKSYRLMT